MTPQPVVPGHSPPIGLVNRIDDMGEEDLGAVQRHHTRQIVQERSRVVLIASNDQLHGTSLRPFCTGRRAANRLDIGVLLWRDQGSRDSPNQDQKSWNPMGLWLIIRRLTLNRMRLAFSGGRRSSALDAPYHRRTPSRDPWPCFEASVSSFHPCFGNPTAIMTSGESNAARVEPGRVR
jgi:hypothetical protein